jgi:hypothetical protein
LFISHILEEKITLDKTAAMRIKHSYHVQSTSFTTRFSFLGLPHKHHENDVQNDKLSTFTDPPNGSR